VTHEENAIAVLASVASNPHISSKDTKGESGVSTRSVLQMLHQHKFHPHHIRIHKKLHGRNSLNHVKLWQWAQQNL
jgi:hypothetical protein